MGIDMGINVVKSGTGAPLVFVHGLGMSASTWDSCRSLLDDRYQVVAVDLPGHGGSPVTDDPADYTRDRALIELDRVLVEFGGRAVLIGHSLGGYLSLAFAATRPGGVRGVIVLNTGPGFRDPVKREEWNDRSRRNAHRFDVPVQVASLNLQEDSVVMDRLAEIETPTLVLAGELDRPEYAASGQYLERKMPSARLVVIGGGGHSMHETHAGDVADQIDSFVSSLPT